MNWITCPVSLVVNYFFSPHRDGGRDFNLWIIHRQNPKDQLCCRFTEKHSSRARRKKKRIEGKKNFLKASQRFYMVDVTAPSSFNPLLTSFTCFRSATPRRLLLLATESIYTVLWDLDHLFCLHKSLFFVAIEKFWEQKFPDRGFISEGKLWKTSLAFLLFICSSWRNDGVLSRKTFWCLKKRKMEHPGSNPTTSAIPESRFSYLITLPSS